MTFWICLLGVLGLALFVGGIVAYNVRKIKKRQRENRDMMYPLW